jgi:hypothetical protein
LHTAALLTARASCRTRSRVTLQSSDGQPQNGFKQRWPGRAPCAKHTVFMIGQAVITMGLSVLQQSFAELRQRLYDLIRSHPPPATILPFASN